MSVYIPDPNTPNPDAAESDAAAAAAANADTANNDGAADPNAGTQDGADKIDPSAAALAAFEKGIAETPAGELPAPSLDALKPDGAAPDKPVDDKAKADAAAATDAAAAATDAAKVAAADKDKLDPAVEKEIKDLGITNERTAKRFRDLSARAAEAEPLRAKAAKLEEWTETIQSTGADPEQLGRSLGYLAAINSRDPAQMNQAYDALSQELAWLGERLGRDAPGFDPLSKHPDLLAQVEAGELPRATAKELAAARQSGALVQEQRTTQDQAAQMKRQHEDALVEVAKLGDTLRAAEPEHFQQKFAALLPTIKIIQRTLPPAQWSKEIEAAYKELPAMAAPAATTTTQRQNTVTNQPLRPSGMAPGQVRAPKTDVDAFSFGVAEAKASGQ